jgi:hypothetical protein
MTAARLGDGTLNATRAAATGAVFAAPVGRGWTAGHLLGWADGAAL